MSQKKMSQTATPPCMCFTRNRKEITMAFWKLYKNDWFKKKIPNMIALYKEYLFQEWFQSLSKKDQESYLEKQKQSRKQALASLAMISAIAHNSTFGT